MNHGVWPQIATAYESKEYPSSVFRVRKATDAATFECVVPHDHAVGV